MGLQHVKNIEDPIRAYAARGLAEAVRGEAVAEDSLRPLPLPDKPSIAVLPFENMSGDPEQEYFADGMVEEIITALCRFKWLFVIARNSSFTFKGKAVDIKEVGRKLGVRYVLEGSVRRKNSRWTLIAWKLIYAGVVKSVSKYLPNLAIVIAKACRLMLGASWPPKTDQRL
jgi:adenylate cyclase